MSMRIVDLVKYGYSQEFIMIALNFIKDSSSRHFKQEEHWMEMYGLPQLQEHRKAHEFLLNTLQEHMSELDPIWCDAGRAFEFFKGWLLKHHGEFDKQLASELNQRGVY